MAVLEAPARPTNGQRPALPLERIEAAAADVDFRRGSRRVVAALFYYPGRFFGAVVHGLGFAVAAWKVGYADGRHPERRAAK